MTLVADVQRDGTDLVEGGISDEELTALALAADGQVLDPAALPDPVLAQRGPLPLAYMPPAMGGRHGRGMAVAAIVVIAVLVTITMLGFCNTYGTMSFA